MLRHAALGTRSPNRSAQRSWRPHVSWRNGSSVATERIVRFTEQFFARLEDLLPAERPGDGTPSLTDFLVFDLPPVHDELARDIFATTLPTEDPDIRVFVGLGALIGRMAIYVRLLPTGEVEAVWIDVSDSDQ
jgi:hypothetical protein